MAIPSNVEEALDRLGDGYNNEPYNPATNPLGFSKAGHRTNLFALTGDIVTVGEWVDGVAVGVDADQVAVAADRATVTASAASVAANKAAVDAALAAVAGGPVISINGKTGVVFTDPTTVVDVQPAFDFNFTSLSGAPFRDALARASDGGMRRTSRGLLASTVINEPVIDFGADGKPKGTGFFGAYTSLLLRAEEFDHGAWGKTNVTVTANAIAAPDGNTTADLLDATVGAGNVLQNISASPGTTIHTLSAFLKQGTAPTTRVVMTFTSGGTANNITVEINWSTKALTITGGANDKVAHALEDHGNGWYRLSISASNSGGANTIIQSLILPAVAATGTVYAWGAQLTATAFPVPYVPTTSAAVVRNADSFILSGTDFTDLFNPDEGTLFAECIVPAALTGFPPVMQMDDGGGNNRHILFFLATSSIFAWRTDISAVAQAELLMPVVTRGSVVRMAFSYKKDEFRGAVNGGTVVSDLSGNLPSGLNRIQIGSGYGSHIKRLVYWPKAFDATTLQRMTA